MKFPWPFRKNSPSTDRPGNQRAFPASAAGDMPLVIPGRSVFDSEALKHLDRYGDSDDINWLVSSQKPFDVWDYQRLRAVVRSSPFLTAYRETVKNYVVGATGPRPTLEHVTSRGDRETLMEEWEEFCKRVSVSGNDGWASVLQSAVGAFATDGRALIIARFHDDFEDGVAFQPLSRDWIADQFSTTGRTSRELKGGTYDYKMGQWYRKSGRLLGYSLYQEGMTQLIPGWKTGSEIFVPAWQVCDLTGSAYSGDEWNYPPEGLMACLRNRGRINALDTAIIKTMVVAANKMLLYTQTAEDGAATPSDVISKYNALWYPNPELMSNHTELLPPGVEPHAFDPTVPNMNIDRFRMTMDKQDAAALGWDYASLTGDLSQVNFSSMRHGELRTRDTAERHQVQLALKGCGRMFNLWLMAAQTRRRRPLHLRSGESVRQAMRTGWRFRAFEYIDPVKHWKGVAQAMSMGLTTPQREASARGLDYDVLVRELAAAVKKLEDAGITPDKLQWLAGGLKVSADGEVSKGDDDEPPAQEDK